MVEGCCAGSSIKSAHGTLSADKTQPCALVQNDFKTRVLCLFFHCAYDLMELQMKHYRCLECHNTFYAATSIIDDYPRRPLCKFFPL